MKYPNENSIFIWNKYFIAIKIARKSEKKIEKKIGMLYSMISSAFRIHWIYSKKGISLEMTKKWKKPI